MVLIFPEMTGYNSLTFANNPLAEGVLPVLMNVANNSQNFRKANLSSACVTMCAFRNLFLNSFPLLGILFLHCLLQQSLFYAQVCWESLRGLLSTS